MPEPRITVVIPVRDGGDFVEPSVRSVFDQTYRPLLVLVVDDGSTDGTAEILSRLAREDDRLEVRHNDAVPGLAGALAFAFGHVSTELIARLDADDLAVPDRIARQISFLDDHREIGLVGSACTVFDSRGEIDVWSPPCSPLAVRWRSLLANPFLHSTVAVRRSVLADNGLNYDARLLPAEDYDLWSRVLQHTDGANLDAPLVRYRLHDGQTTRTRRAEMLAAHDAVAARTIRAELPDADVDGITIRDLRSLFHGGGELPDDPVATASLYLDLLEAFLSGHRDDPGIPTLRRAEARHVLRALFRAGVSPRTSQLTPRLLRLDPLLPLWAVAAAVRSRGRRRRRR